MLLQPLVRMSILFVRVHIGTGVERFRTDRTTVQGGTHVHRRNVLLQRNQLNKCFGAVLAAVQLSLLVVLPPDVPLEGTRMRRHVTALVALALLTPVALHVPSPAQAVLEPSGADFALHLQLVRRFVFHFVQQKVGLEMKTFGAYVTDKFRGLGVIFLYVHV